MPKQPPPSSNPKQEIAEHAFQLLQQGLSSSQAAHQALVHAGYRQPDSKTPTLSAGEQTPNEGGTRGLSTAARQHEADVIAGLVSEAQAGGYAGDVEVLRSALRVRADVVREVDAEVDHALLRAIAKAGGIDPFDMLAHLLSGGPVKWREGINLVQMLLTHLRSTKTQEDDEKLKQILSVARDVTRHARQMTHDEKTSWLATLDQVERELFSAWLPFGE